MLTGNKISDDTVFSFFFPVFVGLDIHSRTIEPVETVVAVLICKVFTRHQRLVKKAE